jgi:hypothetical protein
VSAGVTDWKTLEGEYAALRAATEAAFNAAVNEPKIKSRDMLVQTNSAPVAAAPGAAVGDYSGARKQSVTSAGKKGSTTADNMRKQMTSVFDEILGGRSAAGDRVVYIGEDVRHGG